MKTLILIHSLPLNTVKRFCGPNTTLLFLQDSLYTLVNVDPRLETWLNKHQIYVLEDDAAARGLIGSLPPGVILIDYAGWVELTVTHSPVVRL